jgi:hypothetical protein
LVGGNRKGGLRQPHQSRSRRLATIMTEPLA